MRHGLQILVCRQDSVRPDEATDLKDEREKRGKINTPERPQKDPA
jgi:hypothetical protein